MKMADHTENGSLLGVQTTQLPGSTKEFQKQSSALLETISTEAQMPNKGGQATVRNDLQHADQDHASTTQLQVPEPQGFPSQDQNQSPTIFRKITTAVHWPSKDGQPLARTADHALDHRDTQDGNQNAHHGHTLKDMAAKIIAPIRGHDDVDYVFLDVDDEPEDVDVNDRLRVPPKLKLETMSSVVLNRILVLWGIAYLAASGLLVLFAVGVNTWFLEDLTYCSGPTPSDCQTVKFVEREAFAYFVGDCIFRLPLIMFMIVVLLLFTYHLYMTEPKLRLTYQYFVCFFAFFSILALFPWSLTDFTELTRTNVDSTSSQTILEEMISALSTTLSTVFRGLFYAFANVYVWVKARSFCLREALEWKDFIWPVAICLLELILFYLGYFCARAVWNPGFALFLVNPILAGVIGIGTPYISTFQFLLILSNSIINAYILVAIGVWFARAKTSLRTLSYAIFRSEHIAYHFFRANFLQYFLFHLVTSFIQVFSTPLDFQSLIPKTTGAAVVVSWQLDASALVLIYFVIMEVLTSFPARAADPPKCWKAVLTDDWQNQRIRIRRKEHGREDGQLYVNPRLLVLETFTLLMNFSFLAYQLEVELEDPPFDDVKDRGFRFVAHTQDTEIDSHAGIFESDERIIIAFRGTKSFTNVLSDLQATSVSLASALESELQPTAHDNVVNLVEKFPDLVQKLRWLTQETISVIHESDKGVRLHSGFAEAYRSISSEIILLVAGLLETKPGRTVYVTGHSLGGAMATICAFHISRIFPELLPNNLCLMTYGSPRVGNTVFKHIFNQAVPNYWRVAFAEDPVPKVPGSPFCHVGTLVVMRTDGEMILDPSKIEKWNSKRSGIALVLHRMGSYRHGIETWCTLYYPTYLPEFWEGWDEPSSELTEQFASIDEKLKLIKMLRLREYFQVGFDVTPTLNMTQCAAVSKAPRLTLDRWLLLIGKLLKKRENMNSCHLDKDPVKSKYWSVRSAADILGETAWIQSLSPKASLCF